jgi:WD40 repeat protein
LALSPDGLRLATAGTNSVRVGPVDGLSDWGWGVRFDIEPEKEGVLGTGGVNAPLQFSPDGRKLFAIGYHAVVVTFDVSADTPRRAKDCRIPGLTEWWDPALSPEGDLVACAHPDGKGVAIWDVTGEAARLRGRVDVPGKYPYLAFGPGGRTLAAVAEDYEVSVWDVASGKLRKHWHLPQKVHSVTFVPDGKHLAVNNCNSTVYILRLP